jgi:KUP system potassium uptake protein
MNWILWAGCVAVMLIFEESARMEAAYGLSITVTMLMTTILVAVFLKSKKYPTYLVVIFLVIYGIIELTFLSGNVAKILHGGWFTLMLGTALFTVMWAWAKGRRIKNKYVKFDDIKSYYPIIKELSEDMSIPKYSSQLIYLTSANFKTEIESKIMYSIMHKQPKRADVYWLLHVNVTDEPFTKEYKVDFLIPDKLIRIDFKLGFKVEPKINLFFRMVVEDLIKNKEIDIISRYKSLQKRQIVGDFRFVVLEKILATSSQLSLIDRFAVNFHSILKQLSISDATSFGLDVSFVTIERVPLIVDVPVVDLKRIS